MTPLDAPLQGAVRHDVGGVTVEEVAVGAGRVKRVIYPPGWRWSTHMRTVTGTERCGHAHVGYLVQGHLVAEYEDGCQVDQIAPTVVVVEPGHDAWVVGDEDAILIQFDCGGETVSRFGLAGAHQH